MLSPNKEVSPSFALAQTMGRLDDAISIGLMEDAGRLLGRCCCARPNEEPGERRDCILDEASKYNCPSTIKEGNVIGR